MNRLIRQFLSKSTPLDKVADDEIKDIEGNLNNKSRKVLGYQTPLKVKSKFGCIALQT